MTDLAAVEFESMEAQDFGSSEAIGGRGRAVQALFEEIDDGLRPRSGVVAARAAWTPEAGPFLSAGLAVVTGQDIESAGRDVQLVGSFGGRERALVEAFENMADEGKAVSME
jgi:hypothetical protein